ncbi:MAG: tyrosine-protein phosphatase [Chloroflexi bacterium]|nr:tyrosine-protein phosphatase [Chloroflexota bacterium]
MMIPDVSRRLLLPGTVNLRHVGGYATTDGRFTRPFALFRSDSLHALTPEGQKTLLAYDLNTVIDLRRQAEINEEPNVLALLPQVQYRHMPLYDYVAWREMLPGGGPPRNLLHLYQIIVDGCHGTLGAVLNAAATPDAFPLLVHCKVGKDRTGIVIALLLAAVGVPVPTIAEDYAQSRANLEPLIPGLLAAATRDGVNLERYQQILQSPPEVMVDLFAYFDERYGGVLAYLDQIGVDETRRATLRAQLLEPSPSR